MSGRTKALLAVVAVGALALGAVGGQALAQGGPADDEQARPRQEEFLGRVAARLGVPVDALKDAIQSTELEMLDEAVAAGRARPEVADRLRQRIGAEGLLAPRPGPRGLQARPHPIQRLVLHSAAETLDMEPRDLVAELRSTGQSLAQLAESKGVSREELKSGVLDDLGKHLDEQLERLAENIERIIDQTPGPPPVPLTE